MDKALIIGSHCIVEDLKGQYEARGWSVVCLDEFPDRFSWEEVRELVVLTIKGWDDGRVLLALEALSANIPEGEGRRMLCHLLLRSRMTLWLLQTFNLYPGINNRFEIYPFTMEDQWAKNVLCQFPGSRHHYLPLDWKPVTADSHRRVHLLVYGLTNMGESLALHAALTAHFPNYVRNASLRTRITVVDPEMGAKRDAFLQRYQYLFDHSYYRFVDLGAKPLQQYFHRPLYSATRKDFVDVEWEFVEGDLHSPALREKISLWAESDDQLLTVALCDDDENRNFDESLLLPEALYKRNIPVLVYVRQAGVLRQAMATESYRNLEPFGMQDCGYDINLPLLQLAKMLHYFYSCSYGGKGTPTSLPPEEVEREWSKVSAFNMRYANIYNVMTLAVKMRSLGHKEDDWEEFYALNQEEIETLSAVEHNRWSVDRLILGFRPPTDTEREEIAANIRSFLLAKEHQGETPEADLKKRYKSERVHYDLCAYGELGCDSTGHDVRVYDYDLTACIPLMANSYLKKE